MARRRTISRTNIGQNRLRAATRVRLAAEKIKRTVVRPKRRFP
jgi:hypothetical protein